MSRKDSDVSRRTLLKAGAWSVPVVALAVAAPAKAASGEEAIVDAYTFSQSGVETFYDGAKGGNVVTAFNGSATFSVTWDSPVSVNSATLMISVPAAGIDLQKSPTFSGTGWTYAGQSSSGGTVVYTFVFGGEVPKSGTSPTLTYTLPGDRTTLRSDATPKLATGVYTGNFPDVTKTVTWA